MVEERFYTTGELAKRLNVSIRTVQRWLKQGKLAHYEVLGAQRIPESVVDKLLAKSLKPKRTRLERH